MHVAVLGAGTMGRDVAHACAVAGHEVTVRAGKLGRKNGEGFYVREDGEAVRPAEE